jgi:hypothetical protein
LALLGAAHLPQGAPTSPALANLCGFRLDRRLAGLAAAIGLRYTRYADDLAFSGDLSLAATRTFVATITDIASDEGFRINARKTRIRGRGDRQSLAGLVVNAAPAVARDEYDALRALLHNASRTGLAEQNHAGHADFHGYLAGRIAWVGHRHPARAAKLAMLFDAACSAPGRRGVERFDAIAGHVDSHWFGAEVGDDEAPAAMDHDVMLAVRDVDAVQPRIGQLGIAPP